jgi:hypothetical protein
MTGRALRGPAVLALPLAAAAAAGPAAGAAAGRAAAAGGGLAMGAVGGRAGIFPAALISLLIVPRSFVS